MALKVSEICDAIATTLSAAAGIKSWTRYNQLTEGIAVLDCPRLEVHPASGTTDPSGSIRSTAATPPYAIALIVASKVAPASICPTFPVSFAIARSYG